MIVIHLQSCNYIKACFSVFKALMLSVYLSILDEGGGMAFVVLYHMYCFVEFQISYLLNSGLNFWFEALICYYHNVSSFCLFKLLSSLISLTLFNEFMSFDA